MTYLEKLLDNAFRASIYGDYGTNYTSYTGYVKNDKDTSTISLAVPGLSREDIEVVVKDDGILSLNFLKQNDFFSHKTKTWTLSEEIDVENVTAECNNGMLVITLPKMKRTSSSRKVPIS